ncbi:MAG: hypothetical protein WCO56_27820 [Verrucomicrobiota bacterium]
MSKSDINSGNVVKRETAPLQTGYCIYTDTICQGPVPVVTDGENKFVVFETELLAQREIADNVMIRIQQFLDGERDFEDAITVEEYVVPVDVYPDGTILDECGNSFGLIAH